MAEVTAGKKVFFIPEQGSPCELWKTYFTKLKKEVGSENARMIWLLTWSKNGSTSCTTSAGFNKWLQKNGIDVTTAATRAVADISQIGGNVLGMSKNISKMLSIGIPITLAVVLILVVILSVNTAKNADVGDAAQLIPAGRAGKLIAGAKLLKAVK